MAKQGFGGSRLIQSNKWTGNSSLSQGWSPVTRWPTAPAVLEEVPLLKDSSALEEAGTALRLHVSLPTLHRGSSSLESALVNSAIIS